MISQTIEFHSSGKKPIADMTKWPIFSQLLAKLSIENEPLYKFYNGGCGNQYLQNFEKIFLEKISKTDSSQATDWENWHNLHNEDSTPWDVLCALEETRIEAAAKLKDVQKKITKFYKDNNIQTNGKTTRLAFERFGERANLNPSDTQFFAQRSQGKVTPKTLKTNDN